MCGRYSIVKSQGEIEGAFDVSLSDFDWVSSLPRYNVAPTEEALVLTEEWVESGRQRRVNMFRVGSRPAMGRESQDDQPA